MSEIRPRFLLSYYPSIDNSPKTYRIDSGGYLVQYFFFRHLTKYIRFEMIRSESLSFI